MALMTSKLANELYDLQIAAAVQCPEKHRFVCMLVKGVHRTAEEFNSRDELARHISLLREVLNLEKTAWLLTTIPNSERSPAQ